MVPFKLNGQKIHQSVQLIDLNSPCLLACFYIVHSDVNESSTFSCLQISLAIIWKKKMGVTPKVIRLSNSSEIRSTETEQSGIEQTLRKQARMSNSSNFIFSSAEHRRYCRVFCISFFFFKLYVKMKFFECNR